MTVRTAWTSRSARRARGLDHVGRRLDGHGRAGCRPDGQIVEAVDDDLLDIGAGGDQDRVAVIGGIDRRLDGGEAADPTSRVFEPPDWTISILASVSVPSLEVTVQLVPLKL